jgi:phage shock protein C
MGRFRRSVNNRKIAGLCGAIADAYNLDPNVVRLATIFVALITGVIPFLVTYICGWIIVPNADQTPET